MIDLDAADLIADLATGTYTVTRRAAGTYVHGIATPGTTSTLSITAAVVPERGRDLERLPQGRQTIETRAVYTPTLMLVGAQAGANEADLITIDGDLWEVQLAERWPAAGAASSYCKALVQRAGIVLP